jgi:hypothetical protein
MAITLTRISGGGGKRRVQAGTADDILMVFGTLTFDTSYATGGMTLAPSSIGLKEIFLFLGDGAACGSPAGAGSGIRSQYDYTNGKVLLFGGSLASTYMDKEVPAYTDMSAFTVRFVAYGRK